jgi:hypothetical protein
MQSSTINYINAAEVGGGCIPNHTVACKGSHIERLANCNPTFF